MPLTISQLARRFGLSRSTLLYYDSIGLLSPSKRTRANYRIYSDPDVERMELIDVYRRAGLPLKEIARILRSKKGADLSALFEARLRGLNLEIAKLRRQQQMLVGLMRNPDALHRSRHMDKAGWVAILRAAGLDDRAMRRWHEEFERLSPEAHQDFLESLGLPEEEVARIRLGSRQPEARARKGASNVRGE